MTTRRSKWAYLGYGLGGLTLLLASFIGYAIFASRARLAKTYEVTPREVPVLETPEDLTEGQRLYVARGCVDCHTETGAGRVVIDGPPGRVVGSNLTAYAKSAAPKDYVLAMRHGLSRTGRPLILMPSHEYAGLDDKDVGRLIGYVKSLKPVSSSNPENEVRPLGNILHVLGLFPLLAAEKVEHEHMPTSWPERNDSAAFGKTLASGCQGCHGEHFSGGAIPGAPPEMGVPANLTPHETGIAAWTLADFTKAIREGETPSGKKLNPAQMPWTSLKAMNDTELGALFAYLKQLPPRAAGTR